MSTRLLQTGLIGALSWLLLGVVPSALAQTITGQAAESMPDTEVLEQGPIHAAFAEPHSISEQSTELIPAKPPPPIQELPPEERPEGENVEWLSGYWMWDQSREDFVWVSGMWRDVPPGREWVSGEWQEVDGAYQWVTGFW